MVSKMKSIRRPVKRKKSRPYLQQIYKVNPETNAFIIEVSLDSYNEVFNGWDPSPIKRRDLEPEMLAFIESCSREIPRKYPVELRFYLQREHQDLAKEALTIQGIRNNFHFLEINLKRMVATNFRRILKYMLMSFSFLLFAYLVRKNDELSMLLTILVEGMFIGGWVFLWEAFTLVFFTGQDLASQRRRTERFIHAPIIFDYYE